MSSSALLWLRLWQGYSIVLDVNALLIAGAVGWQECSSSTRAPSYSRALLTPSRTRHSNMSTNPRQNPLATLSILTMMILVGCALAQIIYLEMARSLGITAPFHRDRSRSILIPIHCPWQAAVMNLLRVMLKGAWVFPRPSRSPTGHVSGTRTHLRRRQSILPRWLRMKTYISPQRWSLRSCFSARQLPHGSRMCPFPRGPPVLTSGKVPSTLVTHHPLHPLQLRLIHMTLIHRVPYPNIARQIDLLGGLF